MLNRKLKYSSKERRTSQISDFMIELKVLAIKAKTDDIHTIFLLKKYIRTDIIKIILGYLPIAALEILKERKVAIISVEQEYEFTEERQDYRTETGINYRGREVSIDVKKAKDNYNKDRKSRYFNYNIY